MVHLTLVIHKSKGAGCVVHRAEVVEETPQGIQGLHFVARSHVAIIIHAERRACNDIERSLPKGLVESVLDVDFKQGPGLVCRVLLTVESAGRGVSLFCLFALWMASAWPNTALHLVMRLTASSAARFDLADFNTHTSSCKASWTSVSTRCTSRAAKTAFMFVSRSLRPIQISRTLGLDAHPAQDGHLVDLF